MKQQQAPPSGLAMPTLMVLLSVASLTALLALRNMWVNDQLLNAEADQLRTLRQAEAVLPLAVRDIVDNVPSNVRHTLGSATDTHVFYPSSLSDYSVLQQRLGSAVCQAGICAPSSVATASAQRASDWKTQTQTAIALRATDSPYGANTGWYWVEVFPEENTGAFVYRITAMAQGVLPGSTQVLQTIWKRDSPTSLSGQWLSWRVLND